MKERIRRLLKMDKLTISRTEMDDAFDRFSKQERVIRNYRDEGHSDAEISAALKSAIWVAMCSHFLNLDGADTHTLAGFWNDSAKDEDAIVWELLDQGAALRAA
jgi:hypothetical protein